jgi:3-deoxy-D-manno-octulosonic-acid transferase
MALAPALRLRLLFARLPLLFHLKRQALPLQNPAQANQKTVLFLLTNHDTDYLSALIERLEDDGFHPVFGIPSVLEIPQRPDGRQVIALPGNSTIAVNEIVDHFQPKVIFSVGTVFQPLWQVASLKRKIPFHVLDARFSANTRRLWRLMPSSARNLLAMCGKVMTNDSQTFQVLRRLGLPATSLERLGPLTEIHPPPRFSSAERGALAEQMVTRPIWCAIEAPEQELDMIISAHRSAMRRSHRLLLILVPKQPLDVHKLADRLIEQGWDVAVRSKGQEPEPDVQIYIADLPEEHGLWYCLSAITYMGGTILASDKGRNPMEPASLGSAIIHGPATIEYARQYQILDQASAARTVRNALELGLAIEHYLSADVVASVAQAAWQVSTSGAEVAETVLALARQANHDVIS